MPCRGADRATTSMFGHVSRGHHVPFSHAELDAVLPGLLRAAGVPAHEVPHYSWHSFRVFLACALLANGASAAEIQALCRWRSAEAMRVYARMNPDR